MFCVNSWVIICFVSGWACYCYWMVGGCYLDYLDCWLLVLVDKFYILPYCLNLSSSSFVRLFFWRINPENTYSFPSLNSLKKSSAAYSKQTHWISWSSQSLTLKIIMPLLTLSGSLMTVALIWAFFSLVLVIIYLIVNVFWVESIRLDPCEFWYDYVRE